MTPYRAYITLRHLGQVLDFGEWFSKDDSTYSIEMESTNMVEL